MSLQNIPIEVFQNKAYHLWNDQWLLLTSGDFEKKDFNCMAVGWGSLGSMWSKPMAQIFVRPSRYTYEFLKRYDTFTLCAFSSQYQKDLRYLGSVSGRAGDKLAQTRLTPVASSKIAAPGYAEAELILECEKIYWGDITPKNFLAEYIEQNYVQNDYHRFYFGEILAIHGSAQYGG